MSRAVLISIKPKWIDKIINNGKSMELRKTRPKIDPPFKCFIYCTKPKLEWRHGGIIEYADELYRLQTGEIKFGWSGELMAHDGQYGPDNFLNGKVVGEFVCDYIMPDCGMQNADLAEFASKVNRQDIFKYANGKPVFGWGISNLKIYDNPLSLDRFYSDNYNCNKCDATASECINECAESSRIKRPPQSWQYIEPLANDANVG